MRDDELVQVAPPRDLYDAPADEETARFVGEANLWRGTVVAQGQVRTAIGTLACDTRGHATGAIVVALVRPENVVPITAVDINAPSVFSGPVAADRFLGSVRRLDFKIGDDFIRLETRIPDAISGVAIPPDAIRLLLPTSKI
jgi:putative spermidine/putrescine transport system ATP-binding protein